MTRPVVLAALLAALGCTDGLRGVPLENPKATGKVVAFASVDEPDGLKVLWNGPTGHGDAPWKSWIAGSPDELDAVWSEAAALGDPPAVDFAKYVVIAEAGEGPACSPRMVAIEAEASGLLRPRYHLDDVRRCIDRTLRVARIVAIPRRVLPATVVFLHGHAFTVPEVPFG